MDTGGLTRAFQVEANNNEAPSLKGTIDETMCSPEVNVVVTVPPKPIKKRIFEQFADEQVRECSRNILERDLTNQDLLDKVVDGIFANDRDGKTGAYNLVTQLIAPI